MRIEKEALYPILVNRVTRDRFICCGSYFNHVYQRTFLILFKVGNEEYYQTLRGFIDDETKKIETIDRILEQSESYSVLSAGQIGIIESHYSHGLIHDILKWDVRPNTKSKRRKQNKSLYLMNE